MDTARIRRAFRYAQPENRRHDEDSSEEFLDEQEQEEVIASIVEKDALTTNIYTYVFAGLPLICALLYFSPFLGYATTLRNLWDACVCISNLFCTSWIIYNVPPKTAEDRERQRSSPRRRHITEKLLGEVTWAGTYLPVATGLLGLLLALQSLLARGRETLWPPKWLPLVIFGLCMMAREAMTPVDVEGLRKSRYGYKGA